MHEIEKKLLKDVLHLIVDKGEPFVIDYIITKLPESVRPAVEALKSAVIVDVQAVEHSFVDQL